MQNNSKSVSKVTILITYLLQRSYVPYHQLPLFITTTVAVAAEIQHKVL